MPRVIAYEDAKANRFRRRGSFRTPFLNSSGETPDLPMAFFVQGDADRITKPHFHTTAQFQFVAEGRGKFGRHDVTPYSVHFTTPYTPYGPLVGGSGTGMSHFTLYAGFDPGAFYFPDSLDKLKQAAHRQPWQMTRKIDFPVAAQGAVSLRDVSGMRDDQGLFASSLTMAPNTHTTAPDPACGAGQYLLILNGSLWHNNREHKGLTLVFVEPEEGAFELHAGAEGLNAVILNFPRATARIAVKPAPSAVAGFRKWQCALCAFAYDEALGLPVDGILGGTRWQDVPEDWTCPDCAGPKSEFRMIEVT